MEWRVRVIYTERTRNGNSKEKDTLTDAMKGLVVQQFLWWLNDFSLKDNPIILELKEEEEEEEEEEGGEEEEEEEEENRWKKKEQQDVFAPADFSMLWLEEQKGKADLHVSALQTGAKESLLSTWLNSCQGGN
ncbi:putative F-box protein, partial [Ophiophagus hannah]